MEKNRGEVESEEEDAKIEFIQALGGQSRELAAAGEAAASARNSTSVAGSSVVAKGGGEIAGQNSLDSVRGKREKKHQDLAVAMGKAPVELAEELDKSHKFWSTQPVPRMAEKVVEHGPLEALRSPEDVQATPYELHPMFEWCEIDVQDEAQLSEMYELLCNNYVEDDDSMFRFAYPQPFLRWSLTPPHYRKDWHVGVRLTTGKKQLMACITGVPAGVEVYGRTRKVCEINFLCVSKKLRSKRLAPRLIKEVTRRVNRAGVWQVSVGARAFFFLHHMYFTYFRSNYPRRLHSHECDHGWTGRVYSRCGSPQTSSQLPLLA